MKWFLNNFFVKAKWNYVFFALILVSGCLSSGKNPKTGLFTLLPDYVVTPDGLAISPDGDLVVACPNFADQTLPGCLIKINSEGRISKWVDVPVLKETGVSCPMGIDFDSEGNIYICDNQGWKGTPEGQFKGRILKLKIIDNEIVDTIIMVEGMEHPNGIRVKGKYAYVTQSILSGIKDPSGLLVSAIYRFPLDAQNVQVNNNLSDTTILTSFLTHNKFCQYGVDGLVFDSKGNLFVGNFGDGAIYKIVFDADEKMVSCDIFARTGLDYNLDPSSKDFLAKATLEKMRTTDGICIDSSDNIYVADFSNNAIAKVTPSGEIFVLAQNGDTDGLNGELDQPGEPIVWNDQLIVSNFDLVTGPDKVNSKHDLPATLSFIKLK